MRLLAVFALAVLAGCLEPRSERQVRDDVEEQEWILGGAWTEDHTQDDIDAWCEVAKKYDNECIVMESFPPQFGMRFASEAECRAARAEVLALEHITARECSKVVPSDDPDAPTSSSGAWTLHGTFTPGYTAADIDAVCEAGTGATPCAMMKSEPPQYAFTFPSSTACEEARAAIASVPTARPGPCQPRQP